MKRKKSEQGTPSPKVAVKSAFINRPLSLYELDGDQFLSLNQVSHILGIRKGGPSLVQYVGRENCIETVSSGKRIYYGKSDQVLAYLKRSKKKPATNLYVALLAIIKEHMDSRPKEDEMRPQRPAVAPTGMDFGGWESPAAQKFASEQGSRCPAQKSAATDAVKEQPGYYFDLSAFFDTTLFDLKWIKDNRRLFTREIQEAVHTMLEVGEPLRGEQRVAFTSVISCLASYQSVLNSIC